jgi:hypothetical protein
LAFFSFFLFLVPVFPYFSSLIDRKTPLRYFFTGSDLWSYNALMAGSFVFEMGVGGWCCLAGMYDAMSTAPDEKKKEVDCMIMYV